MNIRPVTPNDRSEWLRMRTALWPESPSDHPIEVDQFFADSTGSLATFVIEEEGGGLSGFLEAAIRETAEGCSTSPVGYIEGWWVDPEVRGQGHGRALVQAAEAWASGLGLREMASDADLVNELSQKAHRALGYAEVDRIVCFRKSLEDAG